MTSNLCRGEHCPNRAQCRRYQMHVAHPEAPSVPHCPDGKWFVRDPENIHPQHKH